MFKKDSKNSAAPLILLAAIALFLLLGLQLGKMFIDGDLDVLLKKEENNVFRQIEVNHPKRKIPKRIVGRTYKTDMPVYQHNVVSGPTNAALTLTIFDDPSCYRCQQQVRQVLRTLPKDIRVVRKFYPSLSQYPYGGLFRQMGVRTQVWPQVEEGLITKTTFEPTIENWSDLFAEHGLSLRKQRHFLAKYSESIVVQLEKDNLLAQKGDVQTVPTYFINNYYVDGTVVSLGKINQYNNRAKAGKPILNSTITIPQR